MRFLGKLSISVLVVWAVIAVSVITLYPLTETMTDKQLGVNYGNSQPVTDSNNSASDNNLGLSQADRGSGNLQSGFGSSIFQSVFGSVNYQSTDDSDSSNSQSGSDGENTDNDTANGDKYSVDNFILNVLNFTAEITNPQNRVTGSGFYEIKTNPAANHQNVLQSGTFSHSLGTFTINNSLTFTPTNNTKYHILIYTNYPEHDNRVSKDDYMYSI